MPEFNLIDEPWIPCIELGGRQVEHGICDTLLKAHELREIYDDSPLVTVSLHRLLLAILYRSLNGPADFATWKELYARGKFEEQVIGAYVSRWKERFYLLHDEYPFLQVAGLDLNEYGQNGQLKKDKSDGLMRLLREAPDKGGRILFDHRVGTERPRYEPEQIARMLVAAHSYAGTGVAFSGKLGNQSINPTPCLNAPCVKGLCVWLEGRDLFETLMLNLVPTDVLPEDLPPWEDDNITQSAIGSWPKPTRFTGPVQRFTPLSRFIRVLDRTKMFYTNGLKVDLDGDSGDPMKVYARSSENDSYVPLELRKDKAAWRDAHTLFSLHSERYKPPCCINHVARLVAQRIVQEDAIPIANITGLAAHQGKGLLWRHERLPVPVALLGSVNFSEHLGLLLREAEALGGCLSRGLFQGSTGKTIRKEPVGRIQAIIDLMLCPSLELRGDGIVRSSDGMAPNDAHNKAVLDLSQHLDPRPAYWARLEEHFLALLRGLAGDWDSTTDDWKPDDQQTATLSWRKRIKHEAQRALEESIRSVGTTARAIQAVARVRTTFTDDDLKPPVQDTQEPKAAGRGGKKKK